ncbi:YbbR-like domain-containing protein [Bacillus sp. V59.32b]|uniref:CdaR family protein n=1 Tax=Bacillus sp. V59.32b TaxID=1758642 RepID=UPI000E3E05C7|nr:CdaR family protein [Bacillus sp. V59.32b]RFU61457.1 YbbR-like domain-containing protein [Bacillus sp. V59.32b]
MDRFMNSPWFFRIVAFALAGLLFTSVNIETDSSKRPIGLNTPGQMDTETIEDIPVEIDYDQENLVVTGAPQTVDITFEGTKAQLITIRNQREFRVYIDLSDPEITVGEKRVPLKIEGMNEKVTATISPKYATVTVQERVTKEFSVEPEFNRSLLEEGYTVEKAVVSPAAVKITGAKDVIEKVSFVKANVELNNGINESINRQATVQAFDRDLNKLDVVIDPEEVTVSVDINIPSKRVPVVPVQTGTPDNGVTVTDISVDPKEITLYGKESVLNAINEVSLPVSVNDIEGNTEIEVPIIMPDNIQKMSREMATVNIKTEKQDSAGNEEEAPEDEEAAAQTKTINNLLIQPVGLNDDMELEFVSPRQGRSNITLLGDPDELRKATASNIRLSINVERLEEGRHEVAIQVNVQNKVKWELPSRNATVTITQRNEET